MINLIRRIRHNHLRKNLQNQYYLNNKFSIEKTSSQLDLIRSNLLRNKTIIEVLYGTGIRVSELTDLKLSNIFFDENILKVTGKGIYIYI